MAVTKAEFLAQETQRRIEQEHAGPTDAALMALAAWGVFCPDHKGYRDECKCPE